MINEDVIGKYNVVRTSLENAIKSSEEIKMTNEDENAELTYIRDTLKVMNQDFKNEIDRLEKSAEWDRFCIAFFGETNAGKSTIIEALRIVYNEELRREEIDKQAEKTQRELDYEREKYKLLVQSLDDLNDSLEVQEKSEKSIYFKIIGLILIGIVIGFVIAFLIL